MRALLLAMLSSLAAAVGLVPDSSLDVEQVRSDAACDLVYCSLHAAEPAPLPPAPPAPPDATPLTVGPPPDALFAGEPAREPPRPLQPAPPQAVTVRAAPVARCTTGTCRPAWRLRRFRN